MRSMNSETVDLIATDPPFNKSRDFHATPDSLASGASFQDRWSWEHDVHETWVDQIENDWPNVWYVINSTRESYGDDMGAYLCFMAVRLIAMHRLLKPTGSIYLHCDPTASHYLKMLMDAIFGRKNFRNEIVWRIGWVSGFKTQKRGWIRNHDILLYYTMSDNARKAFNKEYISYPPGYVRRDGKPPTGKGIPIEDTWNCQEADRLDSINIMSFAKKTGWPTEKPLKLYERIINASSNEGDMVLDPFAGCATTCVAAERLGRQWVGIDIWDKAPDVVVDRLESEGLKAPKYTRRNKKTRQQFLFASEFTFTSELPERTDDEEVAVASLPTIKRAQLAPWQRMSNAEIRAELEEAQTDDEDWIICAGCGRQLEGAFMELDHITPRSGGGANDISNRVLLCSPCNRKKSDTLAMKGLWNQNRKDGWMADKAVAEAALIRARNRYAEVSMRDS